MKNRSDHMERCQSGRMGLIRNQVYGLPYRGFESHPLRQNMKGPFLGPFVFLPSVVEEEGPVRRAQRRSRMPGREATIPP